MMVAVFLARVLILLLVAMASAVGQTRPESRPAGSHRQDARQEVVDGQDVDITLPGFERLNAQDDPLEAVARVIDEETGDPISGAEVRIIREPCCPIADRWPILHSAKSDANGWLRVPVDKRGGWVFVMAPNHAPKAEFAPVPDHPILLRRGLDVPIDVRDWWDRPVEGASIEQLLGCGHTPNVRRVVTDRNGRAVMPRVDPLEDGDLWPVKEGYASSYGSIVGWEPGRSPVMLRLSPAPVIEGIVVDHKGAGVPNVFVGAPRCHRGPWTITDASGRFRIVGATDPSYLEVYLSDGAERPAATHKVHRHKEPIVIRIPAEGHSGTESRPEESAATTPETRAERSIRVVPSDLPTDARVFLLTTDGEADVTNQVANARSLSLPPGQVAALKVVVDWVERIIPLDRITDAAIDVDVPISWYRPVSIRVNLFSPDGKVVGGRVLIRSAMRDDPPSDAGEIPDALPVEGGTADLPCRLRGRLWVYAWPDDPSLRPTRVGIAIAPDEPRVSAPVDIRFERVEPPQVSVLFSDGTPFANRSVTIIREGVVHKVQTSEGGQIRIPWTIIQEGSVILVPAADDQVPARMKLRGPGPWSLRLPATVLEVSARSPDGATIASFVVFADSHPFEARDGVARIEGLAPGTREVWVAAQNCIPKRIELRISDAGTRRVVVALRPKA